VKGQRSWRPVALALLFGTSRTDSSDLPDMPKTPAVFNETRGFYLRLNQARKAVENCACAWVEYGLSVRDLTLSESIAARAQQAKNREPMPYSEVFGLKFDPPIGTAGAEWQSRLLAYEATLFVENVKGVPA
jgi:hypothetical protein